MKFDVTVLGTASAIPTASRNPSSQFIQINDRHFLVDCGEGTQVQIRRNHLRLQKISQIFISHLHGDHYFGLIGLITSMSLLGRTGELHIYSPAGLQEIIRLQLKISDSRVNFPLHFHETSREGKQLIFADDQLDVYSFPLKHRIACNGFLFSEKPRERNVIKDRVEEFKIPLEWIKRIKKGEDYINENGKQVANDLLTRKPAPPRSFAYCSDTIYDPAVVEFIEGADLLYHEATFSEEHMERAKETFHSTASQAARIAKSASVKNLLIGHFSARYSDPGLLLAEAKKEFPSTELAEEGKTYSIPLAAN